jgi:UDP-N-acetylmuramyl pentapeptide phosphotransferase/UDP-N-acetylglucosamine-1-phosphate transferase
MTRTYERLDGRQRLWLQLAFAITASIVGLVPAGVRPAWVAHGLGALFLLACTNALRGLDSTDGLSSIVAACAAAVMACVAHSTGSPAWGDLNLGLCGALLALLAYNVTHGRLRAELGTGGTLAVGFLLGASILRLGEQATPPDRLWLMLPLALPLLNLALILAHRHVRNLPLDVGRPHLRDHLHHQLLRAGLTVPQVFVLYSAASCMTGLVALQSLGLL